MGRDILETILTEDLPLKRSLNMDVEELNDSGVDSAVLIEHLIPEDESIRKNIYVSIVCQEREEKSAELNFETASELVYIQA